MLNVHGIKFNDGQAELVEDIIRELLKDGNCAVYALPHMKPSGELRMAPTPPMPSARRQRGVFLRIRPGAKEAEAVRPMNAKAGQAVTKITKFTKPELMETIRIWRKQTAPEGTLPKVVTPIGPTEVIPTPPSGETRKAS